MEGEVYVAVRQAASEVGFDACGIARAERLTEFSAHLDKWLQQGAHAEMHFMEDHRAMRADPSLLLPGAKSVVSVLLAYKPSQQLADPPYIAQYAYGEDYHERVKRMLYQLIEKIQIRYPDFDARPFVDTAPISDKVWAARAGLGWIGRNTLLIHPGLGSYCYIGELVTTFVFDHYDTPMEERCGSCRRCVEACPNKALTCCLNANRCTSYNTIENRASELPADLHRCGYAFGCDICQQVCPYNIDAPVALQISDERMQALRSLATADEPTFRRVTRHSAMNRIKYPQWLRNLK